MTSLRTNASLISVRVAVALPDEAREVSVQVPAGSTAREALQAAVREGLRLDDIRFDVATGPIGIHGRRVTDKEQVLEGDRVEVYRSLLQDPMERRRREAGSKP